MSIQKFDKNMNIVAALDDEPNDVGGLTSAELKAKFDEGGNSIQTYINNVLLPALESLGVETTVQLPANSAGFKYMRLNADKVLESARTARPGRPPAAPATSSWTRTETRCPSGAA